MLRDRSVYFVQAKRETPKPLAMFLGCDIARELAQHRFEINPEIRAAAILPYIGCAPIFGGGNSTDRKGFCLARHSCQ
jgi:hypothetical protein